MIIKRSNLKYLVPNGFTFLSMACGVGSILAAAGENVILAASLIFISYWLDMVDGFSARKLNAQSEFGLQLDSLTDIVSLGVAPAVMIFQHLRLSGANLLWVTPLVIFLAMAGAFRLARFNMLPPKTTNKKDSVGLTITQVGGTLALAALADVVPPNGLFPQFTYVPLPIWVYIPLLGLFGLLMISTISFPPSSWFFRQHRLGWYLLAGLLLAVVILPIFSTWFVVYLLYIIISTVRALVNRFKTQDVIHE